MLSVAIPDFRLPREVIEKEIDYIAKRGVEIRYNTNQREFHYRSYQKLGLKPSSSPLGRKGARTSAYPENWRMWRDSTTA